MTAPIGPSRLARETALKTDGPSDMRLGRVAAVTAYGIDVDVAGGVIPSAAHVSSYNPAVNDPVVLMRFQDAWVVLGRPVGPGTASDTVTAGLGVGTTLLAGMALSGTGATMASSSGAAVVIPRYGVSFHHPENHWVLLLMGYHWYSSVANDWLTVAVRNAAFGGAIVGGRDHIQAGNNFFGQFETLGIAVPPTYAGAASYYADVQRVNGAGTSRIDDVAARRGYLLAFDLGDGSVVPTV